MDNKQYISNLERLDTATSWAWDFNYEGHTVWMVSEKHADSKWVDNKHGELVGVAEWVTRVFIGEVEIQSFYSTQKWEAWESRKDFVKNNKPSEITTCESEPQKKAKQKVQKVKEKISGLNAKELLVLQRLSWNTSNNSGDFGYTDEVIEDDHVGLQMTKSQVKGYIGSIKKKGLIWIHVTDNGWNQFGFLDEGWKVLSELGKDYLMY